MPRVILTITEQMDKDLKDEAKKTGGSVAGLIRLYVSQSLSQKTGKPADVYEVERGGNRKQNKEE